MLGMEATAHTVVVAVVVAILLVVAEMGASVVAAVPARMYLPF